MISLDEYLKLYEQGIDKFKNDFSEICADPALVYIVNQYCESQKNFSAVIRGTFEEQEKKVDENDR